MATARSLAYLAAGILAGVAGFAWSVLALVTVGLLSVTQLGGPAFLGAAWVTRRIATVERRRVGWVLGRPLDEPYEPAAPGTIRERVTAVARQPATWRDLLWLLVSLPLGLVTGVAAVVATAVLVGAVAAPAWLWAVPNDNAPWPLRPLLTTTPGRFALCALGLLLLPVGAALLRRLARAVAAAARALLAPGAHLQLVREAARLAETRSRVVDAQAAELRRIERDLHDGAQARIVAAGMTLALAARKLRSEGGTALSDVDLARKQLDEALAELRRLVRGIHPPILTDRGLYAAVAALAADSSLAVSLRGDPNGRYPAAVESAAYFVVAEGLANAGKHAEASRCGIVLNGAAGALQVTLTDDGRGGADLTGGGLDGLRRRVEALDGTLTITSPPGGPTVLHAELPCAS
ncbi:sensor domain-containing protein [Micromonospora sp. C28SCA-DRY-2]|uniref:sensor histidine kinase n=1 Tax=Micromonospora sp. C28SCA-DRY-2 TaxID=3059522 RepID=UPI002676DFD2|nr:sensor histidine kinase [Micromonospora sp. C28SCA-DRY-2]MDO3703555.1 sensor domain-containing protein [Micromonospora sp. C28SCA-DRY-2]